MIISAAAGSAMVRSCSGGVRTNCPASARGIRWKRNTVPAALMHLWCLSEGSTGPDRPSAPNSTRTSRDAGSQSQSNLNPYRGESGLLGLHRRSLSQSSRLVTEGAYAWVRPADNPSAGSVDQCPFEGRTRQRRCQSALFHVVRVVADSQITGESAVDERPVTDGLRRTSAIALRRARRVTCCCETPPEIREEYDANLSKGRVSGVIRLYTADGRSSLSTPKARSVLTKTMSRRGGKCPLSPHLRCPATINTEILS